MQHKLKNEIKITNERKIMKGLSAKPELIFFVIIAIALIILFLGGAWLQGWLKGVVV